MESYVGLDVHSKRSVFVIEAADGGVVARGDIPTTPEGFRQLRRQLRAPGHVEHRFRRKPNTHSGRSRTLIPTQAEHRFRAARTP